MQEIDRDKEQCASAVTVAVCAVGIIIIALGAVIAKIGGAL